MDFDELYNNCYDFIMKFKPGIIFYSTWIFLHYVSSHMYSYLCTPKSWYGIIISPFLATAPHCNALRWSISESGDIFKAMWITVGSWIISSFFTCEEKTTRTTRSKS
tara:strand:- start:364 stop:684 length:321 start_codon:yes stop_codon:yes gene_type:complete